MDASSQGRAPRSHGPPSGRSLARPGLPRLPRPSQAHLLSWTPLAGCPAPGLPTGAGSPSPAAPWPPRPQGQCRLQPPARPATAGLPSCTAASCHGGAQRRVRARLPSTGGRGAGPGGHRRAHQATAPRQSRGKASEHHEVSRWRGPGRTGPARPSPVTCGDHSPSLTARPRVAPLTPATPDSPTAAGASRDRRGQGLRPCREGPWVRGATPSKACSSSPWPWAEERTAPVSGLQRLL